MKAQVTSDGVTVWVNAPSGHCLARFGRCGIDIHRDFQEQQTKGECLYCTHERVAAHDWDTFVAKVLEFHKVRVGKRHKPVRFNDQVQKRG